MASRPDDGDSMVYKVVVNDEEQYSIWPADRENPPGWNDSGKSGTKAECMTYIQEVWTDMRPRSLREAMDGEAGGAGEAGGSVFGRHVNGAEPRGEIG